MSSGARARAALRGLHGLVKAMLAMQGPGERGVQLRRGRHGGDQAAEKHPRPPRIAPASGLHVRGNGVAGGRAWSRGVGPAGFEEFEFGLNVRIRDGVRAHIAQRFNLSSIGGGQLGQRAGSQRSWRASDEVSQFLAEFRGFFGMAGEKISRLTRVGLQVVELGPGGPG